MMAGAMHNYLLSMSRTRSAEIGLCRIRTRSVESANAVEDEFAKVFATVFADAGSRVRVGVLHQNSIRRRYRYLMMKEFESTWMKYDSDTVKVDTVFFAACSHGQLSLACDVDSHGELQGFHLQGLQLDSEPNCIRIAKSEMPSPPSHAWQEQVYHPCLCCGVCLMSGLAALSVYSLTRLPV